MTLGVGAGNLNANSLRRIGAIDAARGTNIGEGVGNTLKFIPQAILMKAELDKQQAIKKAQQEITAQLEAARQAATDIANNITEPKQARFDMLEKMEQAFIKQGLTDKALEVRQQRQKERTQALSNMLATFQTLGKSVFQLAKDSDNPQIAKDFFMSINNPLFQEFAVDIPDSLFTKEGIDSILTGGPQPQESLTRRQQVAKGAADVIATKILDAGGTTEEAQAAIDASPNTKFNMGDKVISAESDVVTNLVQTKRKGTLTEARNIRRHQRSIMNGTEYRAVTMAGAAAGVALKMLDEQPKLYQDFINKAVGRGKAGKFQTNIVNMLTLLVLSRSGKQVTDKEYLRLKLAFAPAFFNDPENARFKLALVRDMMDFDKRLMLATTPEESDMLSEKFNSRMAELIGLAESEQGAVEIGGEGKTIGQILSEGGAVDVESGQVASIGKGRAVLASVFGAENSEGEELEEFDTFDAAYDAGFKAGDSVIINGIKGKLK